MESKRQLVAVMFADVVGYTAMMQRDELKARNKLRIFRDNLNEKVPTFHGKIIQYFGDGCLCTFESAVDAVLCAQDLQTTFYLEGRKEPKKFVPVRIGLNSGDVLYEDNTVYGDSVNISSRIESMAVPGSVLLSNSIYEEVKNQTSIRLQSLGKFHFKNVKEPVNVYALAKDGLPLPKKKELAGKFEIKHKFNNRLKWLLPVILIFLIALGYWKKQQLEPPEPTNTFANELSDKRVAVLPFDNQTNQEDFSSFGFWISDHLLSQLSLLDKIKIVSPRNIEANISLASMGNITNDAFARATGADIVIQGRYYLIEDDLILHANISDAQTGEIIHPFQAIKNNVNESEKILEELNQNVLGYWLVKDQKKYEKKTVSYDAYKSYQKGEKLFHDDPEKATSFFIKAIELDSNFYFAHLRLLALYGNLGRGNLRDSLQNYLTSCYDKLVPWERARLDLVLARQSKDRNYRIRAGMNLYQIDPFDAVSNLYAARVQLNSANNPTKALELLLEFPDPYYRQKEGHYFFRPGYLLQTYYQLNEYQKAVNVLDSLGSENYFSFTISMHLRCLVRLNQIDTLKYFITHYNNIILSDGNERGGNICNNIFDVCNEASLVGDIQLLTEFATMMKDYNQLYTKDSIDSAFFEGMAYYWLGDFQSARIKLEQYELLIDSSDVFNKIWALGYKALNDFKLKDSLKTKQGMHKIQEIGLSSNAYGSEIHYYVMAIIYATLGDFDAAVQNIEEFINHSPFPYGPSTLKGDCFIKPLFGYHPFEKLAAPLGAKEEKK